MTKSWVLAASMLAASPVFAVPMQQDQESVQKEIEALKQKLADLEARLAKQEKAKEKMCADPKIQSGSPKGGVSSWEVKHIENTP